LKTRLQIDGCIKIDVREIGRKSINWTPLAYDCAQWRALVSTAVNHKILYVEFLYQLMHYQILKEGPGGGKRREENGGTAVRRSKNTEGWYLKDEDTGELIRSKRDREE
jgi:hypothetical protein